MSEQSFKNRTYGTSTGFQSKFGGYRGSNNRSYRSNNSGGSSRYNKSNRFGRNRNSRNRSSSKPISYDKYIAKAAAIASESIYEPKHKFSEFKLEKVLQANVASRNYEFPTLIQDQAIPFALEGRDVMGLASTGSGKTAAFLLPLINKVLLDNRSRALIIVPTRELATQIRDEFVQFTKGTNIRSVVVIGGASMNNQLFFLRKNPQFVIATPGRLKDLYERRAINLATFNNVVLDEVDRMLDMGFVDEIKFLISKLPVDRQTLFFSATMSKEAEKVANVLLREPVKVEIESQRSSKNVEQDIVKVDSTQNKIDVLHDLLIQEAFSKVLIFSKTKRGADKLTTELYHRGFKVDSLHGDKSQFIRNKVVTKFKQNNINILVATDVAARGLDIADISHVINFDEPATYEDYIHRIGRTGRAGKQGKALTFVG